MDNLQDQIKQLPEADYPAGLHDRIMKKLLFIQFRTPLITAAVLLSMNCLISLWHLWMRMASLDTVATFKTLFDGFEISEDFLYSLIGTIRSSFPVSSFVIFLVNMILLAYVVFAFIKIRKTKGRSLKLKSTI